jgi:hypothetical protein
VGGGLFYGVLKFFKTVEELVTPATKQSIADWLNRINASKSSQNWPETFTGIFDRVFGAKHLSWQCFSRSSVASIAMFVSCAVVQLFQARTLGNDLEAVALSFLAVTIIGGLSNVVPDYVSLLETRLVLGYMGRTAKIGRWAALVGLDAAFTALWGAAFVFGSQRAYAVLVEHLHSYAHTHLTTSSVHAWAFGDAVMQVWLGSFRWTYFVPAFVTSIWLLLYAGSGILIRLLHGTKASVHLIARYFDLNNRPLQSMGLVAGGLATGCVWTFEIVREYLLPLLKH